MNASKTSSYSACAVVTTRLYLFGGFFGEPNTSSALLSNGIYSIDYAKTVATGVAADLQSHSVLDPSIDGTFNQVAVVQPNGHVLLVGGARKPTGESKNEQNPAVYDFDPSKGATSKLSTTTTNVAFMSSRQASAATSGESAVYTFGGVDNTGGGINLSTLTVISPDGKSAATNVTSSGPSARQYATMGHLNETHQLLSGGFVDLKTTLGDQWLLDMKSLAWTRLSATMARARYQHQSFVFKGRYVIHVGGAVMPGAPVEYMDMSTGRAQAGTIVNAANGPASLFAGCAYMLEDVIIYVGGEQAGPNGTPNGVYAPFLSLLQVLPQSDESLKFKWVTALVVAGCGSLVVRSRKQKQATPAPPKPVKGPTATTFARPHSAAPRPAAPAAPATATAALMPALDMFDP
ncbi:hypothetical protein GGF32_009808 [Allomyces javanicus]|nr:hypothetical protein GGF32_009808 [Allomyces javanicus]